MRITITDTLVRTKDMMTAPVDDEIVILSLVSNNYVALDVIGRRIWDMLATSIRVDALCAKLNAEFRGPSGQIERDVIVFLNELHSEGIVQVVG